MTTGVHGANFERVERYLFTPNSDYEEAVEVVIREDLSGDQFGLFVWPSGHVLAHYIWSQKSAFAGKTVVELGAGAALPSLLCAKLGCEVTITDQPSELLLSNIRASVQLNALDEFCSVHPLSWGWFTEDIFTICSKAPEIILASDCFYNSEDFEDVIATIYFLLNNSTGKRAKCYVTYHERSSNRSIGSLLTKWRLDALVVPLEAFIPEEAFLTSFLSISMMELSLTSTAAKGSPGGVTHKY